MGGPLVCFSCIEYFQNRRFDFLIWILTFFFFSFSWILSRIQPFFHCISFSCILLSPPYFFHRFGHVCYEKLEGSQVSSLPSLVGLKGNNGREGTVVAVFVLPFSGYV